ncbi:fused response regulator/phosphatase [Aquisalinus flavus]|uniref:Fused response regulator/phosphatase n=1 Tax=Aquisalinus flavus TaxID=1526572 RepID=A0A8J2Y4R6_9PROT|nr:fused response regulator/phosphatase [Aquisalinus flavus]
MIVEDDDIDFLAVKRHLNWSGKCEFRLTRATSAEAALTAAGETGFDCALVDYTISSEKTFDLLHMFGGHGSAFPVIVLTGHKVGMLEEAAIQKGAFDFLEKTALTQQLLQRTIFYAIENHKVMTDLHLATEDARTRAMMKRHILALVNDQIEPALKAILQTSGDAEKVKAMAERGLSFLKVLAGYARLHDSDLRLSLESFDGAALFGAMIDRLTSLAQQQGVTVTISHSGLDGVSLQGDREKLGQLVEAIASRLLASGMVGKLSLEATRADGRLVFVMAVSPRPGGKAPMLADILSANHFRTDDGKHDLSLLSLAAAYKLLGLMKASMTLPSQNICQLTIPVTVSSQSGDSPVRMLFPATNLCPSPNARTGSRKA